MTDADDVLTTRIMDRLERDGCAHWSSIREEIRIARALAAPQTPFVPAKAYWDDYLARHAADEHDVILGRVLDELRVVQ